MKKGQTNSTHFLYSYVAMHHLCIHLILSKCGDIASFIFFGFCQSLYLVNGNQLHTFFIYNNSRIGVAAAKQMIYLNLWRM